MMTSFRFTSFVSSLLLAMIVAEHTFAADLPLAAHFLKDTPIPQFDPNRRIVINLDPKTIPADLLRAGNIIVRILPGDVEDLRKLYLGRTEGGCRIYNSVVISDAIDDKGIINFAVNEAWLIRDGDHLVPTRYTIAVEKGGLPSGQVWIDDNALEEYFRRSLTFELQAPAEATLTVRLMRWVYELLAPAPAYAAPLPVNAIAPPKRAKRKPPPKVPPKHPPEANCILNRAA